MTKRGSIYSASDKALYDALCQYKMTKPIMYRLFLDRGIIKPKEMDKREAAKYFSRLNHDYYDHLYISEVVSNGAHKERQKSIKISSDLNFDDIESNISKLVSSDQSDDKIEYNAFEKSIYIEIDYTYYDHRKPEFQQVVHRKAEIKIETTDNGFVLRAPDNEYVDKFKARLIGQLEDREKALETEEISLLGITDASKISSFFEQLINGVSDYKLYDVSDVSAYNPETGDEEDGIGIYVKKASLNGEGILNSGEMKELHKKGFYIFKISWSMQENAENPNLYYFHAQFNDPDECKEFSYCLKGYRKFINDSSYSKANLQLDKHKEDLLLKELEKSAFNARTNLFMNDGRGYGKDNET